MHQLEQVVRADHLFSGGVSLLRRRPGIEFQTNSLFMHFVHCSFTLVISADKAYHKQLSVVEIVMSTSEPDLKMVKAHPHHGRSMTCCLMYRSVLPHRGTTSTN